MYQRAWWYHVYNMHTTFFCVTVSPKDCAKQNILVLLGSLCRSRPSLHDVPWEEFRRCFIHNRTMRIQIPRPTCGKILAHAKQQVVGFREHIGVQVCVFKIGITAHPAQRFQDYLSKNFSAMWIVFMSSDASLVMMLEAALISEFCNCSGCRNAPNTGGEGALNRKDHAGPPFFTYVTGGRADQAKRVG